MKFDYGKGTCVECHKKKPVLMLHGQDKAEGVCYECITELKNNCRQ